MTRTERFTTTAFAAYLFIAAVILGFVAGAEWGSPVFDITEIVWLAPRPDPEASGDSMRAALYDIPFRLVEDIREAAAEHDIPLDLAYALISAESDFTAGAVSWAGAIGYTQLMPNTGMIHCGLEPTDLFVPRLNINCGFSYLRMMHDRFGTWRLALIAYHRGPARLLHELKIAAGHGTSELYSLGILAGADTTTGGTP